MVRAEPRPPSGVYPSDEAQEGSSGVLAEIPHVWTGSTVAIFGWVRSLSATVGGFTSEQIR